jgi:hypothetical protein
MPGFYRMHYDGHALLIFRISSIRGSTTPTLEDRCTVFQFHLAQLDKSVGSFLEALSAHRVPEDLYKEIKAFLFHHLRKGDYMVGMVFS